MWFVVLLAFTLVVALWRGFTHAARLESRLVARIEWSFQPRREQSWYQTGDWQEGGNLIGTYHYWRVRVDAPKDVPLVGVRAFIEGERFLEWIELEVMGLPGEGEVTVPAGASRYFNLLVELIHYDGRSILKVPYAKAQCILRDPPLDGTLHLTAQNSLSVRIPLRIVRDESGRAAPFFPSRSPSS